MREMYSGRLVRSPAGKAEDSYRSSLAMFSCTERAAGLLPFLILFKLLQ